MSIKSHLIRLIKKCLRWHWTRKIQNQCLSYGEGLTVNHKSSVTKFTRLGRNVNFNGLTINGGGAVTIGDNFHSGPDCLLISQYHNFDQGNAIPYDDTYILKDICIGDNVWLGSRVIILGGVTLGEGVIIQAGSVVTKSVPPYCIAGGHPAKVFKQRDIAHYERLKALNLFY